MDAHVFNNHDLPRSLLGFAPLANQHDCTITLTKDALTILNKHGKQIIHQTKPRGATLWPIILDNLLSTPTKQNNSYANLSIHNTTHAEQVKFVSASFGNPADTTLLKAV